jgi:hypothetical protein
LFKSVVDYDVFNVKKGAQVKASDLSSGSNSHPDPIEVDDDGGVKNSEAAPVRVGGYLSCIAMRTSPRLGLDKSCPYKGLWSSPLKITYSHRGCT